MQAHWHKHCLIDGAAMNDLTCPLCIAENETVLWQDADCRIILAHEANYPALCRVIWHRHIQEMSDLTSLQQQHMMRVVISTESALRQLTNPVKMNLASLGNMSPHLHWHVIPRHAQDRHYPNSIWGAPSHDATTCHVIHVSDDALRQLLLRMLNHP